MSNKKAAGPARMHVHRTIMGATPRPGNLGATAVDRMVEDRRRDQLAETGILGVPDEPWDESLEARTRKARKT